MKLNPYTQIDKLLKVMKDNEIEKREFVFADGSKIELYQKQIEDMFTCLLNEQPTVNGRFFMDRFNKGIYDEDGFCHLVNAYSTENDAELWRDDE